MSGERGLEHYVSPLLRKAVFDRLHPGCTVTYTVIPIAEAFPDGHRDYRGKAVEAVRCVIWKPDGSYFEATKEIDLVDEKYGKSIEQTPENFVKDCTKALGRALRDAGIPQKKEEMKELMRFIIAMEGRTPVSPISGRAVDTETGELEGSTDPDHVDDPDAGSEITNEQLLARRFAELNGALKRQVADFAKTELGVSNVMRAGANAEKLLAYLDDVAGATTEPDEEPF